MIPKSITPEQHTDALRAYCAALGFDPNLAYFPVVITATAVYFPAVPIAADEADDVDAGGRARHKVLQPLGLTSASGNPAAVLACPTTIEVVA